MTDPQQAVRDLLARARHTDPVPAPVVARLEATLERLGAERRELPQTAAVVPLASRRRRTAAIGLVAAAAVVAAGVGLGELLPRTGGESATSGSAPSGASADRELAEPAPAEQPDGALGSQRRGATAQTETAPPGLLVLSRDGLRAQLLAAGERLEAPEAPEAPEALGAEEAACRPGLPVQGRRVPATYDGLPAVLVVGDRPDGGRRVAVYRCGATEAVRSVRLPVR